MASIMELFEEIAKIELNNYIKRTIDILKTEESENLKRLIGKNGVAKIELALCKALVAVTIKRDLKLTKEIERLKKRKF